MMVATPLERELTALQEQLPNARLSKVLYLDTHEIVVYFDNARTITFPVREWWSDACLARIALECP